MKIESLTDILEIAVRIERGGADLYRHLYEKSTAAPARQIFAELAAEEERHLGIFREMLSNAATYVPRYTYPGEYGVFIEGMAARILERAQKAIPFKTGSDVLSLLEAALSLETETLLFYMDCLQQAQDEKLKRGIQQVIDEEKRHWVRLLGLKRDMAGTKGA